MLPKLMLATSTVVPNSQSFQRREYLPLASKDVFFGYHRRTPSQEAWKLGDKVPNEILLSGIQAFLEAHLQNHLKKSVPPLTKDEKTLLIFTIHNRIHKQKMLDEIIHRVTSTLYSDSIVGRGTVDDTLAAALCISEVFGAAGKKELILQHYRSKAELPFALKGLIQAGAFSPKAFPRQYIQKLELPPDGLLDLLLTWDQVHKGKYPSKAVLPWIKQLSQNENGSVLLGAAIHQFENQAIWDVVTEGLKNSSDRPTLDAFLNITPTEDSDRYIRYREISEHATKAKEAN